MSMLAGIKRLGCVFLLLGMAGPALAQPSMERRNLDGRLSGKQPFRPDWARPEPQTRPVDRQERLCQSPSQSALCLDGSGSRPARRR